MMIVNGMDLPTIPGAHTVVLDKDSAALLRSLADAWNNRVVVTRSRRLPVEQNQPELRRYVERDLRLDLQHDLAERDLTALWVRGPVWYDAAEVPEVELTPQLTNSLPFARPPFGIERACEVRALALPMAAWDGVSWAPTARDNAGCPDCKHNPCTCRASVP